jgi:hypothetical protein
LFLDVKPCGSIQLNFPGAFFDDGAPNLAKLPATCSLDVAELEDVTLEDVGQLMRVTRERVRQIEADGLASVRRALMRQGQLELMEPDTREWIFDDALEID